MAKKKAMVLPSTSPQIIPFQRRLWTSNNNVLYFVPVEEYRVKIVETIEQKIVTSTLYTVNSLITWILIGVAIISLGSSTAYKLMKEKQANEWTAALHKQ